MLLLLFIAAHFYLASHKDFNMSISGLPNSFRREHTCITCWPCRWLLHWPQVCGTSGPVLFPLDQEAPNFTATQIPVILNQNPPDWDLAIWSLKNCSVNSNGLGHWIRVWRTIVNYTSLSSLTLSPKWCSKVIIIFHIIVNLINGSLLCARHCAKSFYYLI